MHRHDKSNSDCYSYLYTPSDWVWIIPLCVNCVCVCVCVCASYCSVFVSACACMSARTGPPVFLCIRVCACVCVSVFLGSLLSREVRSARLSPHADTGREGTGCQNKHINAYSPTHSLTHTQVQMNVLKNTREGGKHTVD
ncbi:hypothetical protein JOB18_040380 [Solea senegalensis]|uniref:Uncharacterized protein n=1 Tax=Solea senegalensis TaxID=28829 RepID=A0AAV6TAJ1_SOLSE|nr:hypothetical protein JOB18_040380 [Solea senegalensis]